MSNFSKSKIIGHRETIYRKPYLSFFLSLGILGLGQIYNSRFLNGLTLFIIRIFSIILLPVYMSLREQNSYISIYLGVIIFNIFLILFSAIEAFFFSKKIKSITLSFYNKISFYSIYSVLNCIVLILLFFSLNNYFTIFKIDESKVDFLYKKNELVLVSRYNIKKIKRGESIFYKIGDIIESGRIIGIEEKVDFIEGRFILEKTPLKYRVIDDLYMEEFSINQLNNIVLEINEKYKYPVTISKNRSFEKSESLINLEKGQYLIVKDNRNMEDYYGIIDKENIIGRIEGILFSIDLKKIGAESVKIFKEKKGFITSE